MLGPDEAAFFREADPWGFILFDRNLETAEQIRTLTASLREAVGRDAPILIDQEGGRVQRLRPPLARQWLPPLEQVERAGGNAVRSMYQRYRLIAHELRGLGIDGNCAPVGDVATEATHPFLKNRCYGTDPEVVWRIGTAVIRGLAEGGVFPVLKHIPGHGRAQSDSHKELPIVFEEAQTLRSHDFKVFAGLGASPEDITLGMTAHVVYPAFDEERPATISPTMIKLIREEIRFDGLLMTDDLSMNALPGTIGERAAAAKAAGCDVILHCNGDRAEMEAVVAVAGRMSDAAETRADRALALRRTPELFDIERFERELDGFFSWT